MTSTAQAIVTNVDTARKVERWGHTVARLGLVVTIGWIGAMKFTAAEAHAIEPLISNSPLMSWLLNLMDLRTVSAAIGVVEVATAVLIALGAYRALFGLIGGALAIGTFLVTLSFLITSTSYEHTFPFFSPGGSFIVKDIVLLGASLIVFATSWVQLAERFR